MDNRSFPYSQFGEYQVQRTIGAGGMGEVFQAEHQTSRRKVAIKVMSKACCSKDALKRFRNEARIQARMQDPGIAAYLDYFEFQGVPYIVMEYIEGETLADLLRGGVPLSLREAIQWFRMLVQAVDCLHRHEIVHRDLKPGNIKITPDGFLKVLDFGLAQDAETEKMTRTGAVIGTLQYMSPEQIQGQKADQRTDIWALGAVFYEMVTGQAAFGSDQIPVLFNHICTATFKPASQCNPALTAKVDRFIAQCLNADPNTRFGSCSTLLEELDCLSSETGPTLGSRPQTVRYWATSGSRIIRQFKSSFSAFRPSRDKFRAVADWNGEFEPAEPASVPFKAGDAIQPLKPGRKHSIGWFKALCAGVGVILLCIFGGLSFVGIPPNVDSNIRLPTVPPLNTAHPPTRTGLEVREIQIYSADGGGPATVYHDGQLIGTTPCSIREPLGKEIGLTVSRSNYLSQNITFTVSETQKGIGVLLKKQIGDTHSDSIR